MINTSRIKRVAPLIAALAAGAAASACGFRLEGSGVLPAQMARTYVESPEPTSAFASSLRAELRRRGLDVVEEPDEATARLIVTEDVTGQRVLSVSARNVPREYEIFYAVTFALATGEGRVIGNQSLTVTRSYTYDETQVLGKAREERVLRQALADDLARQVVRRIEALDGVAVVPAG